MPKYRKKPVVVEAEQWFPGKDVDGVVWYTWLDGKGRIHTLEGEMVVSPGDWVVTGVKGEKYAVKPDIFEQTYEPIEEGDEDE